MIGRYRSDNRARGGPTRGRGNMPQFSQTWHINENGHSEFYHQTPRHNSFTPWSFQPEPSALSSQRLHPEFHSASVAHHYPHGPHPHVNPQTGPYYPPPRIRVPLDVSTASNQPQSAETTTYHILYQSNTQVSGKNAVFRPVQLPIYRQPAPLPAFPQAKARRLTIVHPFDYNPNLNLTIHPNLVDANIQPSVPQAAIRSQDQPPSLLLDPFHRRHFCYRDNASVKCFYFDNWTRSPEFKDLHHLLKERSEKILYDTCKAGISSGKLHEHRVTLLERTIWKEDNLRPSYLAEAIYQGVRKGTFSPLHMKVMLMACKLGGLIGVNYDICTRCQAIFSLSSSHFVTCTDHLLSYDWMINQPPGLGGSNLDGRPGGSLPFSR